MTSPHPRRRLTRNLVIGLASALVGATLYAPAAIAQEPETESCSVPDAGLQERREADALALAAECEAEVLIRDSRDYKARSFAQPDGSVRTEFSAVPGWVPGAAGEWIDADASVEVDSDGSLRSVATVSDLEFGRAGDTAFVTATNTSGERVSLHWTEPLPEPEVDGATVTYPEVLPEVDLEVYSGVADFSYALVVKTPEAATHPELEALELGLDTEGLTVAQDTDTDTAVLTDESGEVAFDVAQPKMWDSTIAETGEAREAPIALEIDADSLTVVPDREMLADPETEFPVYIDPQFSDTTANTKEVFSQRNGISCGTTNELCVGAQLWEADNALGYWRSSIRFDGLNSLANRDIQQVNVWITQLHTGAAGGAKHTVRLYSMDYFDTSGTVSWSTFTGKMVSLVATTSVPTSNTAAGEADQRITWADTRTATRVQSLVDSGANTATFAMLSGNGAEQEGNRNYFRKLSASSAKMTVWHGPLKPTNLKTDGAECSTKAPGPTINTLTPKLAAKAPSKLASDNRISFYLYERNGTHPSHKQQIDFNDVANGATLTGTVIANRLERGKTYRWNARAWDSDGNSSRNGEFSSYCYFTVNSLPATPTDLSTEGLGCGTKTVPTLVTTGTPRLSSVPSDPDGGTVWAKYRFYEETGDNIKEWSVKSTSGVVTSTRVTADLTPTDGLYRWRVITDDAFTSSAEWSAYCWIRIDTTAPEPPDVVQITESPLPGTAVEFEFVGGADVKSFEYSLDGASKQTVSASTGQARVSVTPSTSSIDHSLQVWARDAPLGSSGNTSSPTTHLFTAMEAEPAEALGAWRFDGDLLDDAGEHHLTALGAAVSGVDRVGRTDAAAVFDGTAATCLTANAAIVDTESSYTMGGWVYLEAAPAAEAAVMDVTGAQTSNLKLLVTASGRWGVALADADGETGTTAVFAPVEATSFGAWTHVTAVYDSAALRVRLYINGSLAGSKEVSGGWTASGTYSIGCGIKETGSTFSLFTGSVDDAVIFQQALTDEQIDKLMTGATLPSALQAWYPLRGDGLDHSGRAADLIAMPDAPVWLPDQHGRMDSALELDSTTCPTAGTVPVRTDGSFSASAWVRLDADHATAHPVAFAFSGEEGMAAFMKYNGVADRWEFAMQTSDSATGGFAGALSDAAPTKDQWTQLTATYDAGKRQFELFVDGEHAGSRTMQTGVWRSVEFSVGCSSAASSSGVWEGSISDVRVWRGALDAAEVAATHTQRLSSWALGRDAAGSDAWGASDLTFNGDYSWEIDRWNDCWAAYGLALDGAGWAETTGPVVTTDESFTVTAWTRVDDLDDYRTVISQSGTEYGAFNLVYNPVLGAFQFSMPQQDSETTKWVRAVAPEAAEAGKWYHLAGQVDLGAGVIRLYVNGDLQAEAPMVEEPWKATGPLTIGAAEQLGAMTNQMVGAIDSVQTWSGALDPLSIEDLASDAPKFELDPAAVDCEGAEEPPVDP